MYNIFKIFTALTILGNNLILLPSLLALRPKHVTHDCEKRIMTEGKEQLGRRRTHSPARGGVRGRTGWGNSQRKTGRGEVEHKCPGVLLQHLAQRLGRDINRHRGRLWLSRVTELLLIGCSGAAPGRILCTNLEWYLLCFKEV